MAEATVANCFKAARFNCQGFLPNVPNEASSYEDSDKGTVIYNNYAVDNDDQMSGWGDVPNNGNFTEYVSCYVELRTCDKQKENVDTKSSEDDEGTEIE